MDDRRKEVLTHGAYALSLEVRFPEGSMKTSFPPDTPYETHDDLLTLTEKKAEADAAQALGREIIGLSIAHFEALPLDGRLREALLDARRLTHRGGRVRQLQFVGRLMRSADLAALRLAVDGGPPTTSRAAAKTPDIDQWASRLAAEGRKAIEAFLLLAPQAERTRLAQLVRQLGKAQTAQAKSRSGASLRAYLVSVWDAQASAGQTLH